ncbi:hypothetical protein ACWDE9_37090, partial [Streptomyces olivaceoviridis]
PPCPSPPLPPTSPFAPLCPFWGEMSPSRWSPAPGRPQGLVVGYGTPRERLYPEALETLAKVLGQPGGTGRAAARP